MKEGKIKRYPYWPFHLVASVAILGSFFIYLLNLPFSLIAPWSRKARKIQGVITQWGLYSLRVFQPWWNGELNVELPDKVKSGQSGCLCVANHRSHMDVFLLLEQIRGLRVLTKHLIFLVPGLGGAALLLRMIRVKRGDQKSFWKAMEKIELAMKENEVVHVFPEMTRAPYGRLELDRFTLAPFQKALSAGVPVVPIVIWGTDYLWPKGTYAIATKGPLVVKSLPPVESTSFKSASDLSDHVKDLIQKEVFKLSDQHPYPVAP